MMTEKKCGGFCNIKCDGDHHPLLLALLETVTLRKKQKQKQRNNDVDDEEESINVLRFHQLLRAYLIHGFKLERGVPDSRPNYRYPLIHWAAVLGRPRIVELLLGAPFSVSACLVAGGSHHSREDTALHRLLDAIDIRMVEPCAVLSIVEMLRDSLVCKDAQGNTPFHVCAEALVACSPKKKDGAVELWTKVG